MNPIIPTHNASTASGIPLKETVISEVHISHNPVTTTTTTVSDAHLIKGTHAGHIGHAGNTANNILKGNYPTVTFRPLEARFTHDKDLIGKMDPYCKVKIGWHTGKSSVAKSQGTNPVWAGDAIVLKRKHNEEFAKVTLKDKDRVTLDDKLGSIKIRLDDIAAKGRVNQWFALTKLGKATGEVLMDIEYNATAVPSTTGFTGINNTNVPFTNTTTTNHGILPTNATHAGGIATTVDPLHHHHHAGGIGTTVDPLHHHHAGGVATTVDPLHHHHAGGLAPTGVINKATHATVSFRPIEGRFTHDKDILGKMDPYCKFKIGLRSGKSSVAKGQGIHPVWAGEPVVLKRKSTNEFATVKIKDKDRLTFNDSIGEIKIRLDEIAANGRVNQWFAVEKAGKVVGEVLLDIEYHNQPLTQF